MMAYGVIIVVMIGVLEKDPDTYCPKNFHYEGGWCFKDTVITDLP